MGHAASKVLGENTFQKRTAETAKITGHPMVLILCFFLISLAAYIPFICLIYRVLKAGKLEKDVEKLEVNKPTATFTIYPNEAFDEKGNLLKDYKPENNTKKIQEKSDNSPSKLSKPTSPAENKNNKDTSKQLNPEKSK